MTYKTISNTPYIRNKVTFPHCYWDNAFDDDEISKIENYCNKLEKNNGVVADGKENTVRKSKVSFLEKLSHPELNWVFDKFNYFISNLNDAYYNFNLNGYHAFQYTEYDSDYSGTYNYHIDMFLNGFDEKMAETLMYSETRKLSVVLFLSEPTSYEGGEFSIKLGETQEMFIEQKKGKLICFPSFLLHKVHPLTKGTRKSIVIWVEGPKFI